MDKCKVIAVTNQKGGVGRHHPSTPERMLSTKDTPLGACLLPGRTGLWAKKKPIPQPLTELQNIRKWIKAGLSYLAKTG